MQDLKEGQEIIIDYLTGTFEFISIDSELELETVENTVELIRSLLNVPKERKKN